MTVLYYLNTKDNIQFLLNLFIYFCYVVINSLVFIVKHEDKTKDVR